MIEKQIIVKNSFKINVAIEGKGEPLLCLAGLACSHYNFLPLVDHLKSHFTLYMIDNRGFGKSDSSDIEYTLHDIMEDAIEVMKKLGVSKFSVTGISMGGFVAQLLATSHPDLINKLYLLSTKGGGEGFPISKVVTEKSFSTYMHLAQEIQDKLAIESFVHPTFKNNQEKLQELINLRKKENPVNLEQALKQIRASWKFINERLPLENISSPTLIIHGMEDDFLPLGNAYVLNQRIKNSKLIAIDQTSHLFFFEKTMETAKHMIEFHQNENKKAEDHVGILSFGIYLPQKTMTAKEISQATDGVWSEEAVKEKLGIRNKYLPDTVDGTQNMGVWAARLAIERAKINPKDIDLILCIGEEWKEYPLTTSGIYIQEQIGAHNAWAIDIQQRCCTTIAAMKIAKDMMLSDPAINIVMICGGYRNGDFIDYMDKDMSMMYNLSAGGGAIILQKNLGRNVLLGTHIMSDGSLARDAGVKFGGTIYPIDEDNLHKAYKSLQLFDSKHMKDRLNDVSMNNWIMCIDESFRKSHLSKDKLDYLAVLHFKRSMHKTMLDLLHLREDQSTYLEDYGHIGQIDQILSLELGLKENKIKDGSIISMIAAGIGYAWASNVIKWGPINTTNE